MISTKGRYGLRVMIDLAQNDNGSYIPLKDIAEEYHYNYYWICHVHGLALKSFSEKYKDRKQPQL